MLSLYLIGNELNSTSCAACGGAATIYPAPANDGLNSYAQLSGWRSSHMSVMRVIVLHPCTRVSYCDTSLCMMMLTVVSLTLVSLKFVGLPVWKIWLIFGHDVK